MSTGASTAVTAATVTGLLRARAERSPDDVAFAYEGEGGWRTIRWADLWQRVTSLAQALRGRGLAPGDPVGILARTSLAWELCHHAVLCAGGVVVGLDPHDTPERLRWIAQHAGVRAVIAGDEALLSKLDESCLADCKLVALIEGGGQSSTVLLEALEREGASPLASDGRALDARIAADGPAPRGSATPGQADGFDDGTFSETPLPQWPATLIYTSGTTGQPKGILYRHDQVVLAVTAIAQTYPEVRAGSRFVCWLPLSNLFQRIMNLTGVEIGAVTYLVRNPLEVTKALAIAQPEVFIGVPRFFEKLHEGIRREIEKKPAPLRALIHWALRAGVRQVRAERDGRRLPLVRRVEHRLANGLVLAKLRQVMGGSVRFMVTGSAPAPVRLLEFFHELGLPLYEAYGMSENVVPVAMNRPDAYRIGSVGRPLPQNEIRVADDGELLVRGPGLFAGYYRDSGSSELFTANGYYHTGDYAEIDADGYVALKGRKSEIIKTSAGRRISPVGIEAKLEEVPEVDRAVVFGAGRKCLSALLTLSGVHPVPVDSPSCGTPCELESLRRIVNASVAAVRLLPEAERPAGFLLLRRPLSIERGEITPNLKLRRAVIEAVFRAQLDALYERIGFETASPIIIVAKDNDE